ncbi:MAG: alpha/beta hydrolase [Clostridia bacterium]|nr:alpha/beta hydrolase [Clostridia bacterium]
MQPWLIAVIVAAAVLFVFLLFLVLAFISEGFAFGKRCDKNPLLKYFTAEEFNLTAEPVSTSRGLKGFIYRKNESNADKLIIFCHGMGPGHIAYTTEIAYFCTLGYTVLALDSKGCNFSDGKNLKGMYSGVETAKAAIDYARANAYEKIYLVGHSWGAYSALCASAERKVSAVVAISAPTSPSKTMQEGAVNVGMPRVIAAIFRPFWWIVNLFKFGAKGNANAAKCARKNGIPTLLIHGDKDKIVSPSKAVYYKAEGENITKLLVSGKAHNPYNTGNAEKLLSEIPQRLKKGAESIKDFDFKAATEEDKEVMQKMALFLQNN